MSSGRDAILGKVRSALGVTSGDDARKGAVDARLAAKHRHPTPARVAGKASTELEALLRSYLEAVGATVVTAERSAVPETIARYLREHNLPSRVRVGDEARLAGLDWRSAPQLERLAGPADPADEVGLSHATAGVAETGTLVLASGADNPVTLSFLPETHIVVVDEADIVGPYEDALAKVTQRFGARAMPRTVNMISGPSRTGDIGGKIVMGAHGPRRMCVIIARG